MRRNYLLPKSTPLVLLASIGAQAQMNSFQPASDAALPNPDPDARVRGIIQTSTITYAVDGKQYVAVLTGDGLSGATGPESIVSELKPERGHNAIYVFALKD